MPKRTPAPIAIPDASFSEGNCERCINKDITINTLREQLKKKAEPKEKKEPTPEEIAKRDEKKKKKAEEMAEVIKMKEENRRLKAELLTRFGVSL